MAERENVLTAASKSLLLYGHWVIGNRAVPEGRDGLKPVQRRIIWAMYNRGTISPAKVEKTAEVSGDVAGKYHPHGSAIIDGAITGLTQAKTKANLVIGNGNWGSHIDKPAASRYTECYLSPYAQMLLDPDELACVPMIPTYTGKLQEPIYLPARFPHLLLAGVDGIAYSVSVKIPPLTPEWVYKALLAIEAGKKVQLPEETNYCYGGTLLSLDKEWLKTGNGRALFRTTRSINEHAKELTITSTAPELGNKTFLKILETIKERPDVYSVADDPTEQYPIRIIITFRKNTEFKSAVKDVLKKFKSAVSYRFLYVTRTSEDVYQPSEIGPVEFLKEWLTWRKKFVGKVAKYRADKLEKANTRLHLMIRLYENLDAVLAVLKSGKTYDIINARVAKILKATPEEVQFVLDSAIRRLSTLAKKDLESKIVENKKLIKIELAVVKDSTLRTFEQISQAAKLLNRAKT